MEYNTKYDEFLYSGFSGVVMKISHRMMENYPGLNNSKVLEIGGGARPHIEWIKSNDILEYTISDNQDTLDKCKKNLTTEKHNTKVHCFDNDPEYKEFEGKKFTRIIASHVWEHVPEPEQALIKWVDMLEDDGVLSIALPCDPGLAWRLGQIIKTSDRKRIYGQNKREYDLDMSREHINSAQRLMKILNYYFNNNKWKFFPFFFIPLVEINLLLTINVSKSDFIGV